MDETERLPGATLLATKLERRKFLRRSANTLFYGTILTSTGVMSLGTFLTSPAEAQSPTGPCCPSNCGGSPCCNTDPCCNKPCCSTGQSTSCASTKDGACQGMDRRDYASSCWSHPALKGYTLTCCDCLIDSQVGCPNPYVNVNRCICYATA